MIRARLPGLLLGLFALQPLLFMVSLGALEYLFLWLVTGCFAYMLSSTRPLGVEPSGRSVRRHSAVVAVGFLFVLGQFGQAPGDFGHIQMGASTTLVFVALAVSVLHAGIRRHLDWLDWIAGGVWLLITATLIGAPLAAQTQIVWSVVLSTGVALALWFAVTRSALVAPAVSQRLGKLLLMVLMAVSLAGAVRFAAMYGYLATGVSAWRAGEIPTALTRLQAASQRSAALGMAETEKGIDFRQASIYIALGDTAAATRVLDLQPGFLDRINAKTWDGPVGGKLYYQVSCWKDIMLYPGQVEIRIFARGTPARDVWPLMRVKLGRQQLADLQVTASEVQPYVLRAIVAAVGRQRLTISFLNDYKQTNPDIDRNLWIEHAEIQHRTIAWE
jgi:hypothetical protein